MERYAEDDREGVKKLILSAEKKLTAHQKELDRMEHMFEYERQHADCQYICGIDEVGRGPLAGSSCGCHSAGELRYSIPE